MSAHPLTSGTIRTFLLLSLLLLSTIATIERGAVWLDEASLWKDVLRRAPAKGRAYYPIGVQYLNTGRYHEAVEYLAQASDHEPFKIPVYWDLISAYRHTGQIDLAIGTYEKALAALTVLDEPTAVHRYYEVRMHKELAAALLEKGKRAEAKTEAEKALAMDPTDHEARVLMERIGKGH